MRADVGEVIRAEADTRVDTKAPAPGSRREVPRADLGEDRLNPVRNADTARRLRLR